MIAIGQGPEGGQGGVVTFGPGPGAAGPGSGAVANLGTPTELSDKLGQALGLGTVPAWVGAALGLASAFVNLIRLTARASR